jgi:hypothetical protein
LRYVSEEAQVLADYQTLPQWLKIVREMSHCSARDAKQQILDGLKDRKFAWRWKDTDYGADCRPWRATTVTSDWINWRQGKIYCDYGLTDEGRKLGLARWRTLLLRPKMGNVFKEMLTAFQEKRAQVVASTPSRGLLDGVKDVRGKLGTPGRDVSWKTYYKRVREVCGVTAKTRGYSDRNIERAYQRIREPKQ